MEYCQSVSRPRPEGLRVHESELIELLSSGLLVDSRGVLRGVGDDCAVLDAGDGRVWLVTVDQQIEGVHFSLESASPEDIGHKSLAVSLSDVAAMGGVPRHAFLTLALPGGAASEVARGFRAGFGELARQHGVNLLGGDVARAPAGLFVTVTVLGEAQRERVLYRDGAAVGDRILVTGHLGLAAAGLEGSRHGKPGRPADRLLQALLRPMPRVAEGRFLAESGAVTACIDVSDGLALDLTRLCSRSGVGGRVEEARVVLADELVAHAGGDRERALALALVGGENYELCCTVRAERAESLRQEFAQRFPLPLTDVGEILPREAGFLRARADGTNSPLAGGFDHFAESGS